MSRRAWRSFDRGHRVTKGQGARARAGRISPLAATVQGQLGRARDVHQLPERDADGYCRAEGVRAVSGCRGQASRWNSSRRNHLSVRVRMRPCVIAGNRYRWKKVRPKRIPLRRSVFRISRQSWLASRDSWASLICSRSRSTVKARIYLIRFHYLPSTHQAFRSASVCLRVGCKSRLPRVVTAYGESQING